MSKGMWDLKKLMFAVQGGLCFYCWKPMSQENEHARAAHYATKDHLLPISHGGTEDWTNTILACLACNRLKANRLPTGAEQAHHGHIYALFNERVELRRAEIAAREAAGGQGKGSAAPEAFVRETEGDTASQQKAAPLHEELQKGDAQAAREESASTPEMVIHTDPIAEQPTTAQQNLHA